MAGQRQLGHCRRGAATCFHEFRRVLTVEPVRQRMSSQKANEIARPRVLERRPQKVERFVENAQTAQAKLGADSNRFHVIKE